MVYSSYQLRGGGDRPKLYRSHLHIIASEDEKIVGDDRSYGDDGRYEQVARKGQLPLGFCCAAN